MMTEVFDPDHACVELGVCERPHQQNDHAHAEVPETFYDTGVDIIRDDNTLIFRSERH